MRDGELLDFNYSFNAWYSPTINFSPSHKLGREHRAGGRREERGLSCIAPHFTIKHFDSSSRFLLANLLSLRLNLSRAGERRAVSDYFSWHPPPGSVQNFSKFNGIFVRVIKVMSAARPHGSESQLWLTGKKKGKAATEWGERTDCHWLGLINFTGSVIRPS